jgi:hypothetical protein
VLAAQPPLSRTLAHSGGAIFFYGLSGAEFFDGRNWSDFKICRRGRPHEQHRCFLEMLPSRWWVSTVQWFR